RNNFPCAADQYELVREIGKGACGLVWLAKCLPLDEEVALKILEADDLKCPLEHIMRETQIMHEMRHPNVMPLYCSFVHKEQLWMVMPYVAGGSLFGIISGNYPQGLEEEVVATVALDVLRGLEYMHAHSMIHRDVKAANVLVNTDGRVVLSDFGGSGSGGGQFRSAWACQKYLARNTFTGTPCFMAPEVMAATDDCQSYNMAADVWSFGIFLEELALGRAPYAHMKLESVILTTLHEDAPVLGNQKTKRKFSEELQDIVAVCLQKDPSQRPICSQLLKHKFFKVR
ncbi:kinase-like protein, partial [Coccomyxa subellipsoidea C-169]